jgi:hypothetical protein
LIDAQTAGKKHGNHKPSRKSNHGPLHFLHRHSSPLEEEEDAVTDDRRDEEDEEEEEETM